jgi:hypothetical protein
MYKLIIDTKSEEEFLSIREWKIFKEVVDQIVKEIFKDYKNGLMLNPIVPSFINRKVIIYLPDNFTGNDVYKFNHLLFKNIRENSILDINGFEFELITSCVLDVNDFKWGSKPL